MGERQCVRPHVCMFICVGVLAPFVLISWVWFCFFVFVFYLYLSLQLSSYVLRICTTFLHRE